MILTKQDLENFNYNRNQINQTEKSIEFNFYNLMSFYYKNKYENKFPLTLEYNSLLNIDGLVTIKSFDYQYSILVEAKYHKDFNVKDNVAVVLSQAINYIKTLNDKNCLIPAVVLLIEKNSCVVLSTSKIIHYLDGDYDWSIPASDTVLQKELINNILKDLLDYRVYFYDDIDFSFDDMFMNIEFLCLNSEFKVVVRNNYNSGNVLNDNNKLNVFKVAKDFVQNNNLIYNTLNKKYFCVEGNEFKNISVWDFKKLAVNFIVDEYNISDPLIVNSFVDAVNLYCSSDISEKKLRNNYFIDQWFKSSIDAGVDNSYSYIAGEDLLQSYNNYLIAKGNKPVSFRLFISEFTNHKVFFDNKLEYKVSSRVTKQMVRSITNSFDCYADRNKLTYVLGVSFKE